VRSEGRAFRFVLSSLFFCRKRPGLTVRDFGKTQQYGTYVRGVYYTGLNGTATEESNVFMRTYPDNLCRARPAPSGG